MLVSMHSVNAVFLLGEAVLNNMVALFISRPLILVRSLMVCFFDLDKQTLQKLDCMYIATRLKRIQLDHNSVYRCRRPCRYIGIGLMHLPCYGFFAFIIRMKNLLLSRAFPESYQSER
ncbi:hypothetical protein DVH24_006992 [Malus domestica]|uniref:Uncharacterized protein n=1 Tax=Malus domestica TaxID=3750 RepID=A0A498HE47_MALDO|nr:hypothetical protein DVH24_006992 [Malus domestica]